MRLGVLVSGRGSNLEAVLRADFDVALVISNRPGVRALDVAAAHGVPTVVLRVSDFADALVRDAAIGDALSFAGVDLALLAGYDRLLRPSYFSAFGGRTINIHPSLLPAHGGAGMVGLAVHRSVLDAGDVETGVTIHEVSADLDGGQIMAQSHVPVRPGDVAETLAARVLPAEHRLLVATLSSIARERARGHSAPMHRGSLTREGVRREE